MNAFSLPWDTNVTRAKPKATDSVDIWVQLWCNLQKLAHVYHCWTNLQYVVETACSISRYASSPFSSAHLFRLIFCFLFLLLQQTLSSVHSLQSYCCASHLLYLVTCYISWTFPTVLDYISWTFPTYPFLLFFDASHWRIYLWLKECLLPATQLNEGPVAGKRLLNHKSILQCEALVSITNYRG
jgi:hypothetical protein